MRVPASIRNRNPGAQEPGPSSRKFGSTSHETLRWTYKGKTQVNKCATFPSHQHGAAAMFDLLHRRYAGLTIEKAVTRWCGSYYAGAYAKALEANGGVTKGDVLTKALVEDPDFAIPLAKAMAVVEAGKTYPMDDDEWLEAHQMAFGGAVAPEFAPDNDVPSPGPDARLRAEVKEIAKVGAPVAVTVAGGAVAVQPAAPPAPALPVPPDLAPVQAWKGFGDAVGGLAHWGWANPWLVLAAIGTIAGVWLGPRILRRFV